MNHTEKPLISIIIPCYNAEKYVHSCIESVLQQTYKNWECLLINDGSKDNTLSILEEYSAKDNRFNVFSQENRGLSATRNLGIENAIGNYLFFLDSDDLITKKALQNFVNEIDPENDIITGITVTVNGENLQKISQLKHPNEGSIFYQNDNQEVLIRTIESGLAPVAQNRLYKRSFLEQNNLKFKAGILHEDELWFFETMFLARNVKFINEETYLYRTDNSESITKNVGEKNLNSYLTILENIFERYYQNNSDSYKKAVVERYLNYLKKLIIDFSIREKNKLNDDSRILLQKTLKKIHANPDEFTLLSGKNETYYKALNKLSLFPFHIIEKHFFRNPVNSIRKQYKLLIIRFLLN
ncbi:putative glycosyltransferase EpsH [compost metagenome]